MENTVHIFHHTDLDGMGVKILGMLYAIEKGLPYETHCCGYTLINDEVTRCLTQSEHPSEIIIGDISVNKDVADMIEQYRKSGKIKVKLYDHHESAMYLNEFSWATVKITDDEGVPICGTKLLSKDPDFQKFNENVSYFVETINDWDTWLWKTKNNKVALELNILLSILGENDFTEYTMRLFTEYPRIYETQTLRLVEFGYEIGRAHV